ncbi:MAG: SEC-C metal-binding domain-containing protein [Polyangiaceae bacterium]|jgi:hypothetical protein
MLTLVDALLHPRRCFGDCHSTLTVEQRARAVEALYVLDDALRGWGYIPLYEIHGDLLWREAQQRGDPSYRGVAVRFGECVYRRLVGAMIHECIHASFGDTTKANYGVAFGLPYGVPESVPERDEEAYLAPFNFDEARAFVGVQLVAQMRFGVDWPALNAREWGTYCFPGGNALIRVPRGYRAVAHIDAEHHHSRYIVRARKLEEEARAWLTGERLDGVIAGIDAAAAKGRTARPVPYPPARQLAALPPQPIGRNDPCPCASGKKVKKCCGERAASGGDRVAMSGSR